MMLGGRARTYEIWEYKYSAHNMYHFEKVLEADLH